MTSDLLLLLMAEKALPESKKWDLEPESEYRFELDPGTSLAIKVCLMFLLSQVDVVRAVVLILAS